MPHRLPKNPLVSPAFTLPFALVFLFGSGLILTTHMQTDLPSIVRNGVYGIAILSNLWFIWSVAHWMRAHTIRTRLKTTLQEMDFKNSLLEDYDFRTVTFTALSFGANVLFAIAKGVTGIVSHAWWLVVLAVYYVLLCGCRFALIRYARILRTTSDPTKIYSEEWKAYGVCGGFLVFITSILFLLVILIVQSDSAFQYVGVFIFFVGLYDLYNVTSSLIYMIIRRSSHSPLITSMKMLKFAAALVSLFSLQTAWLETFGTSLSRSQIHEWNFRTGFLVSFLLFLLGIRMLVRSYRNLNSPQEKAD